ncbi:MAG: DUF1858 domain-containing protein [Calditrichaeota bacterium]|nr:DUF1858 domain-containing protein [Calditrichota bacterium]
MSDEQKKITIEPGTKVSDLLEAYPQLESELGEITAIFENLNNPILRQTVAQVTTLRQIAETEKISVASVVNRLRVNAGIHEYFPDEVDSDSAGNSPTWLDREKIAKTLDATDMLGRGEHPVTVVLQEVEKLDDEEIYQLITPFLPEPLLEKVKNSGCTIWTEKKGNKYYSYFVKS